MPDLFAEPVSFACRFSAMARAMSLSTAEDVGQLSVVCVGPEVRASHRANELHIHADLIGRLLNASSRMFVTPSCFAIAGKFSGALLKCCVDVREITFRSATFANA